MLSQLSIISKRIIKANFYWACKLNQSTDKYIALMTKIKMKYSFVGKAIKNIIFVIGLSQRIEKSNRVMGNNMKKILALGVVLLMASSAQAGMYRWVDENGKVHFSDKVPASASKKAHTKLNKSGDITSQVDPEEKQKALEIIAAIKKEKEELAEIRRIKAEANAVVQKRDDNLLSTYENEGELVRFYMTKIKMVEGNTKILEAQNNVLMKKIVKLEDKASTTEHDETLKNIAKKIVNIKKTLDQYKKALDENDMQIIQLSSSYKANLSRYKELTQ